MPSNCPYCGEDNFFTEFVVSEIGPPMKGYNQCSGCNKWSKNCETSGQSSIPDPDVKPVI